MINELISLELISNNASRISIYMYLDSLLISLLPFYSLLKLRNHITKFVFIVQSIGDCTRANLVKDICTMSTFRVSPES